MSQLFNRRLSDRLRSSGASPLITYYNERNHVRIELSGSSFANWVDKTAGLLTDELLIDPGQRVRLELLRSAPGHWVGLVWAAAIWRVGCSITLSGDTAVEVVGPEGAQQAPTAGERVACSLHPMGLGFDTELPTGTTDYGVEVRAQPDSFTGPWPTADSPAWIDGDRTVTQADLLALPGDSDQGRRTVVDPATADDPWSLLVDALVAPVLTDSSVVIIVGADSERQAQIAATERAQPGPSGWSAS